MNSLLLDAKLVENGLTGKDLAEQLGIDPVTFYRKKNGISDFYRTEMQKIKSILHLTDDDMNNIFFEE